ncbi:hypothetical protein [Streptomyces sp. NBC_00151]|uniref:hypothetical protein n=1 Tax=Streptomyces sp. NBC_00151 TaxID=2975669 RepID=UPI002DDBAC4F|nr:hypothetical protein [Streptomyces sp. NBC_00151]WRZ37324.1 hypothetical protein OG915_04180 [Streptomyces sp. NBC_00151]
MPTITVDTSANDSALRKDFTKSISLWLRTQEVDINHVITRFTHPDEGELFSGPFPLTADYAFVRLTIDRARPETFRRELAQRVVRELGPRVAPERVFVQLDLVDPRLHFTGSSLLEEAGRD